MNAKTARPLRGRNSPPRYGELAKSGRNCLSPARGFKPQQFSGAPPPTGPFGPEQRTKQAPSVLRSAYPRRRPPPLRPYTPFREKLKAQAEGESLLYIQPCGGIPGKKQKDACQQASFRLTGLTTRPPCSRWQALIAGGFGRLPAPAIGGSVAVATTTGPPSVPKGPAYHAGISSGNSPPFGGRTGSSLLESAGQRPEKGI